MSESSHHPDREIVDGLRKGSHYSLRRLEQRYRDRLFSYALSKLGNEDEAGDIAGDTLLQILRSLEGFSFKSGDNDFRNWVFTICNNKIVDKVRQRGAREQTLTFVSLDMVNEDEQGNHRNPVREEVERQIADSFFKGKEVEDTSDLRQVAQDFMSHLSERDRTILICCLNRDFTQRQIAEILGTTENNVKQRFFQLKKRCVQHIKQSGLADSQ